ncbi:MAG: hypothetical protein HRT88_17845 [Lentisphaeraceae bacterium]|nr:hypothetical protein [Lentisphaeraceae bacterium]
MKYNSAIICFIFLAANSQSASLTIADVGSIDSYISSTKLPDNNKSTSLNWAELESGLTLQQKRNRKKKGKNSVKKWANIDGDIWAREFTSKDFANPDYFLLKVHPIKIDNQKIKNKQFLFQNIGNTNWAVIDVAAMIGASGSSIINFKKNKFKYIETYLTISEVTANPEPESYILLGVAVLGLISCHQRRK